MRKSLYALMAIAALALGAVSYAQSSSSSSSSDAKTKMHHNIENLKAACKDDLQKFCSDVNPGEGRIAACMDSKSDQLSPNCKKAWVDTQARISQKMDKAQLAFRKNCGSDVQKFCSNVPAGRGRLMDCLTQHEDSLSNSCKNLQAKVKAKAEEMFG